MILEIILMAAAVQRLKMFHWIARGRSSLYIRCESRYCIPVYRKYAQKLPALFEWSVRNDVIDLLLGDWPELWQILLCCPLLAEMFERWDLIGRDMWRHDGNLLFPVLFCTFEGNLPMSWDRVSMSIQTIWANVSRGFYFELRGHFKRKLTFKYNF